MAPVHTLDQRLTRVGIWADHKYSAGELLRLLAHALGSDRLDQARVIILDVSDTRAHRPAGHLFGGKWRQQGFEFGRVGGFFAKPNRPGFGLEDLPAYGCEAQRITCSAWW